MSQVDSNEKQLSTPEIITLVAAENTAVPLAAALMAIVKEGTMPNTEVKQYGNTVFITHFSKDRDLAIGRALNKDTARNFIDNGAEYFTDLVQNGTRKFVAQFKQKSFALAFKALEKRPITTEQRLWIFDTVDGKTQVRIIFDGNVI